ncbi:MAG: hypothetical protein WCR54_02805 [Clostridia bacterium]
MKCIKCGKETEGNFALCKDCIKKSPSTESYLMAGDLKSDNLETKEKPNYRFTVNCDGKKSVFKLVNPEDNVIFKKYINDNYKIKSKTYWCSTQEPDGHFSTSLFFINVFNRLNKVIKQFDLEVVQILKS